MTTPAELCAIADDLDELREHAPDAAWYDLVRRRVRDAAVTVRADRRPVGERYGDVIEAAPRLAGRLRKLDRRLQRIERLVELADTTASGSFRSPEATRVVLHRLACELRSLAHCQHRAVMDSVAVDLGGPG